MMNIRTAFVSKSLAALFCTLVGAAGSAALAQAPAQPAAPAAPLTVPERVAALKGSLGKSAVNLRQYEWIETTTISLKGEEKSKTQNRCYYGADGKKQEVPVAAAPEAKKKRGLRGKIVENKKEELSDYTKQAVALVKSYIPPDPAKIEAARAAGKVSLTPVQPGVRVRLDIKDFQKPGDTLSIEMNPTNNTLLGLKVATWLKDAKDPVSLDVQFGALADGTSYPATIALLAPSEKLGVNITNSGYRKP